ncbi:DUF6544 family protein [Spirosoma linguale]|uniref:Uncharacterized protein n=1 Tax=Spirosoma linguale (strain ATCC 33905 / DSM 74 / LMG 10896 / Claus 1) TaxID=504472 RepID=D2QG53_SPILD|nr:hypothetical protein Slin_0596 [Spirosoma linguale DSM 74]
MFRIALTGLLLLHGLIHVLGFINLRWLTRVAPLQRQTLIPVSENISKLLGLGWLLACFGFVIALIGYWVQRDGWITLTLISVALSQLLIIVYWPEAKAGTLVNELIALALLLTYARLRFDQRADSEARQLLWQARSSRTIITADSLKDLPLPVRQWLTASGVVGKEPITTVRLRQQGLMRTSPDGAWMPTQARQYFSIDPPGFVWKANVQMRSFLPLAGRDKYTGGKGNMLIKALSLVPVVDAADAKTDQGSLLRFLGEMCWFPSAALSSYLSWRAIDATQAEATMQYAGVTAKAVFAFDAQHRLTCVTARRYMGGGQAGKLETWYIPCKAWKTFQGITIPVAGDVIWKLPAGDFTYYQWKILSIDYNKPALY